MQQVNLYIDEFRPNRNLIQAKNLALLTVLMVVLQFVWGGISLYQSNQTKSLIAMQRGQLEQLEHRVAELRKKITPQQNARWDQQIAQLHHGIKTRKEIEMLMAKQNLGNEKGFASLVESIARQANPNLSIHRFMMTQGGGRVELKGETRDAKDVPEYVSRLRGEISFAHSQIGLLSVSNKSAGIYQFSLGFETVFQTSLKREYIR